MTYLTNTVLNDFQAREATNEKFIANYGMIDLAKDSGVSQDYIPPSVMEKLNTMSGSRDGNIPVLKDQTVTVTTTPGFANIPVNLGESGTYAFTAFDVFSGFRMYPASFENNQMDASFYRDEILKNVLQAMAVSKDNIIETVIETRKTQTLSYATQVSQGDGTFSFNASTDTLEINKAAQKDTLPYNLQQLMIANQLPGSYRIVTSPGGLIVNDVEAMKFQNENSKNLAWAQSPLSLDRRYISDQISTSANFNGFLIRDGGIGLAENYPFDFRNGTMFGGKEWGITDVEMPFTRSRLNFYINKEATDATSIISPSTDTNLTMTHWEEMALWDRFYVFYRYNSDLTTRQNDVVKLLAATS